MRLSHLKLKNYRRFEEFEINFHPELTVIAALNGQGKTTILEAIAAALGPFVGAFDEGKSEHIKRSDVHYRALKHPLENSQMLPVTIDAEIVVGSTAISWQRALNSLKGRTTTKEAKPLSDYGAYLQSALRKDQDVTLPVLRYYSSKRLWVSHKNVDRKGVLMQTRSAGYEDCLSSMSSSVQLQNWITKATRAERQTKSVPEEVRNNITESLKGVANAVDCVMKSEGWNDFEYSYYFDEITMIHPDHGPLPISYLSDGVRAMVSMVADLALRCVRLNSHLGQRAPQESEGIVLIDEVDLHLHPAWQQKIIPGLRKAFPMLQFIVTSHSPQVLSTVKSENIRIVHRDLENKWHAECPNQEILGLESSVALRAVMGVSPIPPKSLVPEVKQIAEYTILIENGTHDSKEGQELRARLIKIYGEDHDVIRNADRLIRLQEFKRRTK